MSRGKKFGLIAKFNSYAHDDCLKKSKIQEKTSYARFKSLQQKKERDYTIYSNPDLSKKLRYRKFN